MGRQEGSGTGGHWGHRMLPSSAEEIALIMRHPVETLRSIILQSLQEVGLFWGGGDREGGAQSSRQQPQPHSQPGPTHQKST